ncbi:MAG: hypothetical protein AAF629_28550 [Chloroflexota bacterium]
MTNEQQPMTITRRKTGSGMTGKAERQHTHWRLFSSMVILHPKHFIGLMMIIWGIVVVSGLHSQPLFAQETISNTVVFTGVVEDENGPVEGVSVRIQATEYQTLTTSEGTFVLKADDLSGLTTLVAAAKGYFLKAVNATPNGAPVTITLRRHHRSDNLEYQWESSVNCGECHTAYLEWQEDAHGNSAKNPRFISMFKGTDLNGNRSPNSDYDGGFPKLPDLTKPYYGPGFKVDFPQREGNCASCHTPLASNLATTDGCGWSGCHQQATIDRSDELPEDVSPIGLKGVATEGISCDFCHKIGRVRLDKETKLPDKAHTGILSLSIYRPGPDEKLLFGSVDDVSREGDSYLPLQKESAFCAGCHYGVFSETLIYNSYGEWLDSPYSDPETGETCQDCHMPLAENYDLRTVANSVQSQLPLINGSEWALPAVLPNQDRNYFVFPWKDGLYRDPRQVHNHNMPGASNETLLRQAVTMKATANAINDQIEVTVGINNDKTGHYVPTGSPLRNMILVVTVVDENGNELVQVDGGQLPNWAGNYAGSAGKGFAKILQDRVTGQAPSYEHWRLVDIIEDTRIPPLTIDTTTYQFSLPASGAVTVKVQLLFRRSFQELADWKGWDDPDILMAEETLIVDSKK